MPRPYRQKAPLALEEQSHIAVADALRVACAPGWLWSHFPAGEHRDKRTAAKLERMGLKPGWPDFLLISPTGQLYCLEMKRGRERLKPAQQAFYEDCVGMNVPYRVARSFEEALGILWEFGAIINMRVAA